MVGIGRNKGTTALPHKQHYHTLEHVKYPPHTVFKISDDEIFTPKLVNILVITKVI